MFRPREPLTGITTAQSVTKKGPLYSLPILSAILGYSDFPLPLTISGTMMVTAPSKFMFPGGWGKREGQGGKVENVLV